MIKSEYIDQLSIVTGSQSMTRTNLELCSINSEFEVKSFLFVLCTRLLGQSCTRLLLPLKGTTWLGGLSHTKFG